MYSLNTLDIRGYRQEAVPNTFFQQQEPTDQAAIVFPGLGYTCQGSVLYYPTLELAARGADVLQVEYNTRRPEYRESVMVDGVAACQALLQHYSYRQLTFIGKSLGTAVMGHVLTTQSLSVPARAIWLTPLLHMPMIREQMRRAAKPSLFIVGTADPIYDAANLAEVQRATQGQTLVIEGADHGMNIPNDALQSIRVMEQVIRAIQSFLG